MIVQHPETVGHGPQLFQTFMVHRNPVVKVMLSEKNLVSICSEYNHVRTWNVTRFRGMISTQPGSTPLASFNVVSLEAQDCHPSLLAGNVIGELGRHAIPFPSPSSPNKKKRTNSCFVPSPQGRLEGGFCSDHIR